MAKDDLLKRVLISLNEMDFVSQRKTEQYFKIIISIVAVISFLVSLLQQRFSTCVYSVLIAGLLCSFAFVPAWPQWKKHNLKWLVDAKKVM